MKPYVTFNGISSADLGLRLVHSEPFIIPHRSRKRERIPGRLGSITQAAFDYPELRYRLRLAVDGGKALAVEAAHAVAAWALGARVMQVWHTPGHYYTGAVEGEASFEMLTRQTGQLELEFVCDPPCRHRAKTAAAWLPALDLPIPEQISASAKTAEALSVTGAVELNAGAVGGALPPALFLRLTGSWSALQVGSLQITEGSGNANLYIDCDAQEVYKIVTGVRTIVKHKGDYPTLTDGKLTISGSSLNLSAARLLVIERG